jgi:hypothetical protein
MPFVPGAELSLLMRARRCIPLGYFNDPEHAGLQSHLQAVKEWTAPVRSFCSKFSIGDGLRLEMGILEADSLCIPSIRCSWSKRVAAMRIDNQSSRSMRY